MVKKVMIYKGTTSFSHSYGCRDLPQLYFDATTRPMLRRACLKILELRSARGDFKPMEKDISHKYFGPTIREINAMPRGQDKKTALQKYRKMQRDKQEFNQENQWRKRAREVLHSRNLRAAEKIVMERYSGTFSIEPLEEIQS